MTENPLGTLRSRLWKKLPWAGILAAVLAFAISCSDVWRSLELKIYDLLIVSTAPQKADLPITIVGIDEQSFAKLQLQWPWPRSIHARLLDNLRQAGAAAVAFDVVFAEPSAASEDSALAEAIKRHGNVILAADMAYDETGSVRKWFRVDPIKLFLDAGAVPGMASIQIDPDGVQRSFPQRADAFWSQVIASLRKRIPDIAARTDATPDMRIRYLGGPHTFSYIPYYQLLEPEKYLPANWKSYLENNVVLVGRDLQASTDVGSAQADMFQTPFFSASHQLMPGVEIQANLIANMVNDDHLKEAPRSWSALLWLFIATISVVSMRRWQPIQSSLIAIGLLASLGAANYALFLFPQIWLPAAGAMLTVLLVYLTQGSMAYLFEHRYRRQLKAAFKKYVAPSVVEQLISQPERLRLGGERRELTLLFTDLAGFTSISESMAPDEVANLLNHYLNDMVEIILRHQGTVDKFIGDAIMAFWGAPVSDPDQALHAVDAAIEMQQRLAVMRQEILQNGGPEFIMRIGIHRGECIVGNMGGENRFDYTAIGDAVNLAARLEGVNKVYGTDIIVSSSIAEAVAGKVKLRRLDTVRVKGKQQGMTIYSPCADETLVQISEAALTLYQQGKWESALRQWEMLATQYASDPVAQTFLQRIRAYLESGAPDNWDGITTLESK